MIAAAASPSLGPSQPSRVGNLYMRTVMLAVMLTGVFAMGGCSFLNAGGAAKTRWANIEKQRAMKANPELAGQQICKSVPITGSNLPQRVCSTQAEWDAAEQLALQDAENFNRQMRDGNAEPGRDGVER